MKNFKELYAINPNPSYADLLQLVEWREKREVILERDNLCCTECGSHDHLHVHHKFYIKGRHPWDYEDSSLITLCSPCHQKIHKETIIPYYGIIDGIMKEMDYTPCKRCHGAGYFPEYDHVNGGTCFRCEGNHFEELIPKKANFASNILGTL